MIPARVAFIELNHGGHRMHFIRMLAEACAPDSNPLLITTSEAVASREFEVHLGELTRMGALRVATVGSAREPTRQLVSRAVSISTRGDDLRLVVPEADRLLAWLLWESLRNHGRRLPELRLLIMRTPEPSLRLERKSLVALVKIGMTAAISGAWPRCRCFFLTDAFGIVKYRRGYRWTLPVRDPSPGLPFVDGPGAKRALGLPTSAFVLGLLGNVTASKNPGVTLRALRLLSPKVVTLVAGTPDDQTSADLTAARRSLGTERIVSVPGYLSNAQLGQCVSACDAIVLMYDLDAPSGMLASAVEAGIPVIAGRSPWVIRVVTELRAGLVSEPTAEGVAQAVKILMAKTVRSPSPRLPSESPSSDFTRAMLGI